VSLAHPARSAQPSRPSVRCRLASLARVAGEPVWGRAHGRLTHSQSRLLRSVSQSQRLPASSAAMCSLYDSASDDEIGDYFRANTAWRDGVMPPLASLSIYPSKPGPDRAPPRGRARRGHRVVGLSNYPAEKGQAEAWSAGLCRGLVAERSGARSAAMA